MAKCQLKLNSLPFWVHGISLVGTIVVTVILLVVFLIYRNENIWQGMRVANEFIDPIYNETVYVNSIFRTRVNTWSNLSYVFVGFYAIALAIHDWRSHRTLESGYLASTPIQSIFFGSACIYVGLGSGFFHASLTHLGQQVDVGGMYAVMIAIASLCVGSWFPFITIAKKRPYGFPTWPVLVPLSVFLCVYFFIYKWDFSFTAIAQPLSIGLLIFAITGLLHREKRFHIRWLIAGVAFFVAGLFVRQVDIQGRFSTPESIWQGHSIWHLLSGLYLVCTYLYFRSEQRCARQ
jgi:hypothetical protein